MWRVSNGHPDGLSFSAMLHQRAFARQQATWVEHPLTRGLHPALSLTRAPFSAITRTTSDIRGRKPRLTYSHAALLPRTITKLARLELRTPQIIKRAQKPLRLGSLKHVDESRNEEVAREAECSETGGDAGVLCTFEINQTQPFCDENPDPDGDGAANSYTLTLYPVTHGNRINWRLFLHLPERYQYSRSIVAATRHLCRDTSELILRSRSCGNALYDPCRGGNRTNKRP